MNSIQPIIKLIFVSFGYLLLNLLISIGFLYLQQKEKKFPKRLVNKMESVTPTMEVRHLSKDELWQVRELALQIFPITYQEIVEPEQIDYMMDLFYTAENLLKQFESGQVFLIIYSEDKATGYASYTALNKNGEYKLNKIYVDTRLQGKGLGRILLNDVISRVRNAGGKSLQLNVNRFNKAVGFYKSMGFVLKKEELLDIGRGYFMDDYVMEISLKPKT
jgi:ribosomal protein S18 acetylase RimI-like enzyme